jgi:flagellar biosynthesis protein FlhB
MAEDRPDTEEQTEPASAKKREDSRKRGKVVKSVELNMALLLLFGLLILSLTGGMIASQVSAIAREIFSHAASIEITPSSLQGAATRGFVLIALTIAPVALGLMAVGMIANLLQVGFLFSLEAIQPKWHKLNPVSGLKNIFISRRSAVELAKGVAKICIVGLVAYSSLDSLLSESVLLVDADVQSIAGFMEKGALAVGFKTSIAMLVVAVLDYGFQRYQFERDIRMTKQEAKEEFKMLEGDPAVKGRIKTIQRQIAYKRMMTDVPKSDVVVTNPTHLALALKYDPKNMTSPKLVAKGADLIAQKIREIAREHHIPIVEDKPLAQALYKNVEVGEEIPEKLFHAVAQVLAYIYRMRDKAFNQVHGR